MLSNQPMFSFDNINVSWDEPHSTSLCAIPNEDGLHHGLDCAISMLDNTNLEAQQVTHLNATATAGMLLKGSSIGRSFEANNFTIMGCHHYQMAQMTSFWGEIEIRHMK